MGKTVQSHHTKKKEFQHLQKSVESLIGLWLQDCDKKNKNQEMNNPNNDWKKGFKWMNDHSKETHTDSGGNEWILCKSAFSTRKVNLAMGEKGGIWTW